MRKKKLEEELKEMTDVDYEEAEQETIEMCEAILPPKTEKELLVEVYEFMKSRGINSIGDVENKIARL